MSVKILISKTDRKTAISSDHKSQLNGYCYTRGALGTCLQSLSLSEGNRLNEVFALKERGKVFLLDL